MGEINIPDDEKAALRRIDVDELGKLVRGCIVDERPDALQALPLSECGPYVSREFGRFEGALSDLRNAKSAQKRERTHRDAVKAGDDLSFAVRGMQDRMRRDEADAELFQIDDRIRTPSTFTRDLRVGVSYRWRRSGDDAWNERSIVFLHTVDTSPDHSRPPPARKPSASARERDLQDRFLRDWESLKSGALYSIRDYFREGRDGSGIPETYEVRVDPGTRVLNNHSTEFWRD